MTTKISGEFQNDDTKLTKKKTKKRLTLASWAFRSFTSASRPRFSLREVLRLASLEWSRASWSLSRTRAASRSDSFFPFLQRNA